MSSKGILGCTPEPGGESGFTSVFKPVTLQACHPEPVTIGVFYVAHLDANHVVHPVHRAGEPAPNCAAHSQPISWK
jgi:hypothetical protein